LIGGDTTQGPLNICITVFGEVPTGQALLRSGARAGDELYVSATVGDARLALECFRGRVSVPGETFTTVRRAMERPLPRVALGVALRGLASSAIDVSDGLLGDLGHLLRRSNVGATVRVDAVPRSPALAAMPLATQRECTLAGGDDYELLFTAPLENADAVQAAARRCGVGVTAIGRIESAPGLRLIDAQGQTVQQTFASFDHFL
jgi:thiamine-monophosphate kinase